MLTNAHFLVFARMVNASIQKDPSDVNVTLDSMLMKLGLCVKVSAQNRNFSFMLFAPVYCMFCYHCFDSLHGL